MQLKKYIAEKMEKVRVDPNSVFLKSYNFMTNSAVLNFILEKVAPDPSSRFHIDYYPWTYNRYVRDNVYDHGDMVSPYSTLTEDDRRVARELINRYIIGKYGVASDWDRVIYTYFSKVADNELPLEATWQQLYDSL